jgi:pyridoxamine 5'-phosphate oxidase
VSHSQPLSEHDLDPDPIAQFNAWFDEATRAGTLAPEAMAVATASADGAPSVRMVLLKQVDARGFVFFTNYESRKGRELTANPRAALLFHWEKLGRQVRVEGAVQRVSREETETYVRSRPRGSQLSALASPQSQVVEGREELEALVDELTARYASTEELPAPDNWGGFRVSPERIEFWQHRNDRLHDRLRYTQTADGGWVIERLAP